MKDKIVVRLTAALWIVTELAAVTLLILYRVAFFSISEHMESAVVACSYTFLLLAVLLITQGIGYAVSVIRHFRVWNDIGKTFFWLGAVLFFGLLTIPVYWYRHILYKDYYN